MPGSASVWRTALVTGASSGIGAALARQLATEGTDLVVVARDKARLDALAAQLADARGARGGVAVEVLPADLTDAGSLAAVEARVADADRAIDLVVNNAGFGTYGPFIDADIDAEELEIALNVTALVRLTYAAVRAMVPRGRGAIMNISSMAALQATPGNAIYGATKGFVAMFGEAVSSELDGSGVTVTTVLPGFTHTEFHLRAGVEPRRPLGMPWQSAEDCAAEALTAAHAGKSWVVTGTVNKLAAAAAGPVPRGVRRWAAARVASHM
ncbi:MAG TPA: SDR family NAD(P)-dependent oxidoreductase [Acidimicrobiales bacterium]